MGKSKKRIFNKNVSTKGTVIKREDIIKKVLIDVRNNNISDETKKMIGLFGITSEELSEAGLSFEELFAVQSII